MLKRIWLWLTHYAVIAKWDDVEKLHWARDEHEAREWMQMYSARRNWQRKPCVMAERSCSVATAVPLPTVSTWPQS